MKTYLVGTALFHADG